MSGTYTMTVRASGGGTGSYVLSLDCILGPCDRDRDGVVDPPPQPLPFGPPGLTGSIAWQWIIALYCFHGTAGTQIILDVDTPSPSNLDVRAHIYGPDGLLFRDGHSSGGFRLTRPLTQTGTYTLFISPHDANSVGPYTLSLFCAGDLCP